jgi:hypothetical protein
VKNRNATHFHVAERSVVNSIEFAIRLVDWINDLKRIPTSQEIEQRFDVSRATAYRWRQAMCAARGVAFVDGRYKSENVAHA